METIHNYIEALFASLPQTADILSIKEEMLANLEEKLQDMIQNGMNENEAIGMIIAGIGSVEDLKRELGIRQETGENVRQDVASETGARAGSVDPKILKEYREYRDGKMAMIAIAVACFILSPCMYLLFETVFRLELAAELAFFLTIAVGVVLCILAGRHDDYYKRMIPGLESDASNYEAPGTDKAQHKGSLAGLFAGIAFPLATIVYLCLGFIWNLWHPGWIIFPVCGIITGAVGSIDRYRKGL